MNFVSHKNHITQDQKATLLKAIEQFKECLKSGFLTEYDGIGYLATKNKMSNISFLTEFTHVIWLNK